MTNFRWLHLSDLHVGVATQTWLWPTFKTKFLDDLSRLSEKVGIWDAVLFTGDLTQQASFDEFQRLDEVLTEIWERLSVLGQSPTLVTLPGNHDLSWPDPIKAVMLEPYWRSQPLRDGLFDGTAPQKAVITDAFAQYESWRSRAVKNGRHAEPLTEGLMPGDAAYRLVARSEKIGVVTLNSTWLDLSKEQAQGNLAVDIRQLLAVTVNDPDNWCDDNQANFLISHHPVDWLHKEAQAHWRSDINPPNRFDLHLYGHMHEHDFSTISQGGGGDRRSAQASALFGLEYLGDGKTQRIQGYSGNELSDLGHERRIRVWPRILKTMRDGSRSLTPDIELSLDDDQSFSKRYVRNGADHHLQDESASPVVLPPVTLERASADIAAELEKIRYFITDEPSHRNVRRLELRQAVAGLEQYGVTWIVADWGMGEAGFLSAIQAHFGHSGNLTFRFDLSEYENRNQFLSDSLSRFGASFETLCENISTVGPCYILLNDVPVDRHTEVGSLTIESDIESLAKIVKEFANNAKIVLRSQRRPRQVSEFPIVELKAMDEADLSIYVRDSPQGGSKLTNPEKVSQLYRMTDGVPSRVDDIIKELEVTSIEDLQSTNVDLGSRDLTVTAPPALIRAVADLEISQDESDRRALDLLKALAALPQGEELSQIARLNGPIPFRPAHAIHLTDRALLDSNPLTALAEMNSSTSRALIVPRPVREFIRSQMNENETDALDRKLLELYFGDSWKVGRISSSRAGKRAENALCPIHEIANASALIVRLLRRAVERDSSDEIDTAIALVSSFVECLMTGNHDRSAAALCDDVLHMIPVENRERQLTILRYERARSLRMVHRTLEALTAFEELEEEYLTKVQRQSMFLNLAFCYRSLGRSEDAKLAARKCIAVDRRSGQALQAESVIAGELADPETRNSKLIALRKKSDRQNSLVGANNIALKLAEDAQAIGDNNAAYRLLREVVDRARKDGDFYNGARAIAKLANIHDHEFPFSQADKLRLIDAYRYAHTERRSGLFDQCHTALWDIFERELDIENLLSLYRHSSFIWRLAGREKRETGYLERLKALAGRMQQPSRDREYFYVRVTIVLGIVAGADVQQVLPSKI